MVSFPSLSSATSITPAVITPPTARGPMAPVPGPGSHSLSGSRDPETARAAHQPAEMRGERGEQGGRGERGQRVEREERAEENRRAEPEQATSEARNGQSLDEVQLRELRDLKARDREVRAHEQAHQAVGGQYAGAVSYTYQRGPDGNHYAVGGQVSIDISPVEGDPQATVEKMHRVRAAAMAPAQPSAQDRAVAAQAMQLLLQAQAELALDLRSGEGEVPKSDVAPAHSIIASNTYQSISDMVGADLAAPGFSAIA